jgi:hypothetical protein
MPDLLSCRHVKMEAAYSFEMLVMIYQSTFHHISDLIQGENSAKALLPIF